MAIRNNNLGGTDIAFEETNFASDDFNDTINAVASLFYADNTGGSIDNSTTETDLATVTITQNDIGDNGIISISSGLYSVSGNASGGTGTFRLYVDGTLKDTVVLQGVTGTGTVSGTSINFVETGVDTTGGNVIVKITGQNQNAGSGNSCTVNNLVVTAYER